MEATASSPNLPQGGFEDLRRRLEALAEDQCIEDRDLSATDQARADLLDRADRRRLQRMARGRRTVPRDEASLEAYRRWMQGGRRRR